MHVLFLCSGNVCRSPIAERLTHAYAQDRNLGDLTAESAGTRALVGFPIEPVAASVIVGLGGVVEDFKARRLRPEMIKRADLILAMTDQIRDKSMEMVLGTSHCTFTLLEALRIVESTGARTVAEIAVARREYGPVDDININDPVGLREAAFEDVGERIAAALFPLLDVLDLKAYVKAVAVAESEPEPAREPVQRTEIVEVRSSNVYQFPRFAPATPFIAARAASSILDYPKYW